MNANVKANAEDEHYVTPTIAQGLSNEFKSTAMALLHPCNCEGECWGRALWHSHQSPGTLKRIVLLHECNCEGECWGRALWHSHHRPRTFKRIQEFCNISIASMQLWRRKLRTGIISQSQQCPGTLKRMHVSATVRLSSFNCEGECWWPALWQS
jgi:hypothetical protein